MGIVPAQIHAPRPDVGAVVRRIVETLEPDSYDQLYTLGGVTIDRDAKQLVHAAANRHISWVSGEFDHLT